MKNMVRVSEMMGYLPSNLKNSIDQISKDSGLKVDGLEIHRYGYSDKSASTGKDKSKRQAERYVSCRSMDRDCEIVIPSMIDLKEFRKCGCPVLVNHNYSLLPIGSDESIECDDWGIKALTNYADTGEGTLANVVWALVSQGHMKSSSIGFVPTSTTKPGAKDWDKVANQLQRDWKEFDKTRAEQSVSRIITSGVLLEHSDVTIPCNTDASVIQVLKGYNLADKVIKHLGYNPITIKADSPSEPCVCDKCGKETKAVAGAKCSEKDCTGTMKAKSKEKAVHIRVVKGADGQSVNSDEDGGYASDKTVDCECSECGLKRKCADGSECSEEDCDGTMEAVTEEKGLAPGMSYDNLREALQVQLPSDGTWGPYVNDVYDDYIIYCAKNNIYYRQTYAIAEGKPVLVGSPVEVQRMTVYVAASNKGWYGSCKSKEEASNWLKEHGMKTGTEKTAVDGEKKAAGAKPTDDGSTSLAAMLKQVLDATFRFYKAAHIAHWNVTGSDFTEWHDLFGEIYDDAWNAVDPLAENIRKLGEQVTAFSAVEGQAKEAATDPRALAVDLLADNDNLIALIKQVFDTATDAKEQGIANFLADRQDVHAKWGWQLRASLGLKSYAKADKGALPGKKTEKDITTKKMDDGGATIKVIKPADGVKVLFTPPDAYVISKSVTDAVTLAISKRTGKLI